MKALVERFEQVLRTRQNFVVNRRRRSQKRKPAALRRLPAGQRDHRRDVAVQAQFEIAAVHARGRVGAAGVDHLGHQIAARVLRQGFAEAGADDPGGGGEFGQRHAFAGQAGQQCEAAPAPDLCHGAVDAPVQGRQIELGALEKVGCIEAAGGCEAPNCGGQFAACRRIQGEREEFRRACGFAVPAHRAGDRLVLGHDAIQSCSRTNRVTGLWPVSIVASIRGKCVALGLDWPWQPVGLGNRRLQIGRSGAIFTAFLSHSWAMGRRIRQKLSSLGPIFAFDAPSPTGC